jgi:hypothetical protein
MSTVLNMTAIRESLVTLDRLAAEHPELLGQSTPEEWEAILKEALATGGARQKRLREKRQAEGLRRIELWANPVELESLRGYFPGPREGVNWQEVIKVALSITTNNLSPVDTNPIPSAEVPNDHDHV